VDISDENLVDYYELVPVLSRVMDELVRPENLRQRSNMVRCAGLQIDLAEEEEENEEEKEDGKVYTIDEVTDLANLLIGFVRVKPRLTTDDVAPIVDRIDILLPADETVQLAVRTDTPLPIVADEQSSQPAPPSSVTCSTTPSCTCIVKAYWCPYDGESIVLRAVNGNDRTELDTTEYKKHTLSLGDKGDDIICERLVSISKVISYLQGEDDTFASQLGALSSYEEQLELLGQRALAGLKVEFLTNDDTYQSEESKLKNRIRGNVLIYVLRLPEEDITDACPSLKLKESASDAILDPDVLANPGAPDVFIMMYRGGVLIPISISAPTAVELLKMKRLQSTNASNLPKGASTRMKEGTNNSLRGHMFRAMTVRTDTSLVKSRGADKAGVQSTPLTAYQQTRFMGMEELCSEFIKKNLLTYALDSCNTGSDIGTGSGIGTGTGTTSSVITRRIASFVTVKVARRDSIHAAMSSARELLISAIAADGTYAFSNLVIPVAFPTCALLDKSAAREYVTSLVSRLHLEVPRHWNGEQETIKIHIN
jgi:hypothetical protein